jgi:hypothetical protein
MRIRRGAVGILLALAAAGWVVAGPEDDDRPALRASLRTVTGSIVAVSEQPGEGGLPVVTVALSEAGSDAERLEILLAPRPILEEIEFTIEEGDEVRLRVLADSAGPFRAHKAMNLTRGTMVRFRTLRGIPLWDSGGNWGGGGCRHRAGQGGGPRGRGPGR